MLPKGGVADKIRVCAGSQLGLLILMSFSGPCNLASGGFLAAPPLINNRSDLLFGTREGHRGWSLAYKKMGDKKRGLRAREPHAAPLGFTVSAFAWQSNKAILYYFTQNSVSEILKPCNSDWDLNPHAGT